MSQSVSDQSESGTHGASFDFRAVCHRLNGIGCSQRNDMHHNYLRRRDVHSGCFVCACVRVCVDRQRERRVTRGSSESSQQMELSWRHNSIATYVRGDSVAQEKHGQRPRNIWAVVTFSWNTPECRSSTTTDNSAVKLRHPRCDAYSAEQVLLNTQQIWGWRSFFALLPHNLKLALLYTLDSRTIPPVMVGLFNYI